MASGLLDKTKDWKMNEITMDNLANVLAEIMRDGSKIICTDSGNGCAGPMLVEPSDLLEDLEQFNRVVSIMDLCDADLANVVVALTSFGMPPTPRKSGESWDHRPRQ